MKHRCIYFWVFSLCCICTVSRAQNKEAQWSIDNYHHYYGEARKVSSPEKEIHQRVPVETATRESLFQQKRQYGQAGAEQAAPIVATRR